MIENSNMAAMHGGAHSTLNPREAEAGELLKV